MQSLILTKLEYEVRLIKEESTQNYKIYNKTLCIRAISNKEYPGCQNETSLMQTNRPNYTENVWDVLQTKRLRYANKKNSQEDIPINIIYDKNKLTMTNNQPHEIRKLSKRFCYYCWLLSSVVLIFLFEFFPLLLSLAYFSMQLSMSSIASLVIIDRSLFMSPMTSLLHVPKSLLLSLIFLLMH